MKMTTLFQLEELEDKDWRLKQITEDQEKNRKLQALMSEKTKKDVNIIKKQLSHERNMKLDAFQRVDELQTQVQYLMLFLAAVQILRPLRMSDIVRHKKC